MVLNFPILSVPKGALTENKTITLMTVVSGDYEIAIFPV